MADTTESPSRRPLPLPAIVSLVVGLMLSIALFYGAREFDRRRVQLEFDNFGDEIGLVVQSRIAVSLQVLQSIANLYASSQAVDAVEFRHFTSSELRADSGIDLLAWVPRVAAAEVPEHERQAIAELHVSPGYRVYRSGNASQPPMPDELLYPILFAEPAMEYGRLIGWNLGDSAECREIMQRAARRREMGATLSTRIGDGEGIRFRTIVLLPIYRNGAVLDTVEQRSDALEGFAAAGIQVAELFKGALASVRLRGQTVQLIDPTQPTGREIVFSSGPDGTSVAKSFQPWQRELAFAGRRMLVRGLPTDEYVGAESRKGPLGLLAGGVVFTLLVSSYVHSAWGRARRVEALVARRTAQLSESEQRHRAVVQQASEGIYLVDAESHRVIEANAALGHLLGYPLNEIRGRPVEDFVNDTSDNVLNRIQKVLGSPGPLTGERTYRRKDGTPVDVAVSATVIDYLGRRVLCTVVHDITERKRAQKALEDKNAELERAVSSEKAALADLRSTQTQLVQAEKLAGLGQMVAGVAHEINNPLAFVANNIVVLQRDLDAIKRIVELYSQETPMLTQYAPQTMQQIKDLAERIDLKYTLANLAELLSNSRDGLRRIQQIVKDLRDFARLDQGELQEADLNAGIESTVNIILGRARKRGVQIVQESGPLPPVLCYPAKVNQVVMNLLSNAIDASSAGGTVTIRTQQTDSEVRIVVQDTGSGIPPEIRERIFDPFFTTKPPGEGTGLGLSISYAIMRDHGGSIEVESVPGTGTTFTLHLPVRAEAMINRA